MTQLFRRLSVHFKWQSNKWQLVDICGAMSRCSLFALRNNNIEINRLEFRIEDWTPNTNVSGCEGDAQTLLTLLDCKALKMNKGWDDSISSEKYVLNFFFSWKTFIRSFISNSFHFVWRRETTPSSNWRKSRENKCEYFMSSFRFDRTLWNRSGCINHTVSFLLHIKQ